MSIAVFSTRSSSKLYIPVHGPMLFAILATAYRTRIVDILGSLRYHVNKECASSCSPGSGSCLKGQGLGHKKMPNGPRCMRIPLGALLLPQSLKGFGC